MNNPTATAISLTTFFKAYPSSSPPKKPPPIPTEAEIRLSVHKCKISLLMVIYDISIGYPMDIVLFKYIQWISMGHGN